MNELRALQLSISLLAISGGTFGILCGLSRYLEATATWDTPLVLALNIGLLACNGYLFNRQINGRWL